MVHVHAMPCHVHIACHIVLAILDYQRQLIHACIVRNLKISTWCTLIAGTA
jgi:hypothetical protein